LLKKSYQQNFNEDFTDDASAVESAGNKIYLVEGDPSTSKSLPRLILNLLKNFSNWFDDIHG
jgi:hypothetical protein